MAQMKKKMKFLLLGSGIVVVGWFVLFEMLLYRRPEVLACQNFLRTNEVVRGQLGEVQEIYFMRRGANVSGLGEDLTGRYFFRINGTQGKGRLFVDWRASIGRIEFIAIGEEKGFERKFLWEKRDQE
jgi:hypothetical protein